MSAAEDMRKAADRLDGLVGGGTSGPWSVAMDPETGLRTVVYSEFIATRYPDMDPTIARITSPPYPDDDEDREIEWGQTTDAELMATFSPEVVDLLAAWLRSTADPTSDDPNDPWPDWAARLARLINGGTP